MSLPKHIIRTFAVLICMFHTSLQAQSLDEFFVDGISSQIQIVKEIRSTLLSRHKSGKGSEMTLRNGNTVRILEYQENNYLKIQTSEHGFFALKRWMVNEHAVFGLSWWVCTEVCDGHIKFIDTSSLDKAPTIPTFSAKDFLNQDSLSADNMTPDEFVNRLEADFNHCEFTASDTIWVINNTPEILDELRVKRYQKYWKGNALPVIFKQGDFVTKEALFRKQP